MLFKSKFLSPKALELEILADILTYFIFNILLILLLNSG
jgi:hypothetical protein